MNMVFHNKEKEYILINGAGGVCKAILLALKKLNFKKVFVINRSKERLLKLNKSFDFIETGLTDLTKYKFDVLINATPVGMSGAKNKMPFDLKTLANSRAVMDVVVNPIKTIFCKKAEELKKLTVSGYVMSAEQARLQFYHYTGKKIDFNVTVKLTKKKTLEDF